MDLSSGLEPFPGIKILLKITERERDQFSGIVLTVHSVYLSTFINIFFSFSLPLPDVLSPQSPILAFVCPFQTDVYKGPLVSN